MANITKKINKTSDSNKTTDKIDKTDRIIDDFIFNQLDHNYPNDSNRINIRITAKNKSSANKNLSNKKHQINNAINFLEELSWLLDTKKISTLQILPELLRERVNSDINIVAGNFVSPNPNKHFLVGVLPSLFQDRELFPTNEDIAEFARSALNLTVSRFEKRSKYELIGLIICETNELSDGQLTDLVSALATITGSRERLNSIIEARKRGSFSWNEAIKKIANTGQND